VPDPVDADIIAENANSPADASVDGMSASQVPIPDQIDAAKFTGTASALDATAENGGPRSGWNCTRPARHRPPGAV